MLTAKQGILFKRIIPKALALPRKQLSPFVPRRLALQTQGTLLKRCVEGNLDLFAELARLGYTYDSLRYRQDGQVFLSEAKYLQTDEVRCKEHGVPSVSFFSGCGGLDLGFESAGFHHLASFEFNALFCQTLRKNRPNWRVFGPPEASGDLRNREETQEILGKVLNLAIPFEGVFHGGPPCQSFSIAANQRFAKWGDKFKRIGFSHSDYGNLLLDFLHYILVFKPRVFLVENVPGLRTVDGGEQVKRAIQLLSGAGYQITGPRVLDASKLGVPQFRTRFLLMGFRGSGRLDFPDEDRRQVPCYKAFERSLDKVPNHDTRLHRAESIIRYMELAFGDRDDLGRVDRLDPNLPAKTVIAGGTAGGGRSHLHSFIPRTLSARECARLQTFPDNYLFLGPPARQFTQVGNAVPPLLGYRLARAIYCGVYS